MAVRRRKKTVPETFSFEEVKAKAPEIPSDTCPYINLVQEALDTLERKNSDISKKQIEMLDEVLEYIRTCNSELRKSSKYWYDCYKRDIGKE